MAINWDSAVAYERARIRRAQQQALRELRELWRVTPVCSEAGSPHRDCTGECALTDAIRAIDRATRAPRKARAW